MGTKTTAQDRTVQQLVEDFDWEWLDSPMVKRAIASAGAGHLDARQVLCTMHDMMTDLEAKCPNVDYKLLSDATAGVDMLSSDQRAMLARQMVDLGSSPDIIQSVVGEECLETLAELLRAEGWQEADVVLATGWTSPEALESYRAHLDESKGLMARAKVLRSEGRSLRAIGLELGISHRRVCTLLQGILPQKPGPRGNRMMVVGKFAVEHGTAAAMKEFGISKSAVINNRRKYLTGWPKRGASRTSAKKAEPYPDTPSMTGGSREGFLSPTSAASMAAELLRRPTGTRGRSHPGQDGN